MKTMTCKDLGGPCDTPMTAETPEQMIAMGTEHVKSSSDEAHVEVQQQMKDMTEESGAAWNADFMKKWEAKEVNVAE